MLSRSWVGLVVYRCPVLDTSRGTISSNQVARINATFGILAGGVIDSHVSSKRENCSTIRLACYSYARLMINRRSHAEMKSLSSVCLCVYLSVCLSVCLPVCLSLSFSLSFSHWRARTISTLARDRHHDRFHDHGSRSTGCWVI